MKKKLLVTLLFSLLATAVMSISAMACDKPGCFNAQEVEVFAIAIFESEADFRLLEHKINEILLTYYEPYVFVKVFVAKTEDGYLKIHKLPLDRYSFSARAFCMWGNPSSFFGVTAMRQNYQNPPMFVDVAVLSGGCLYRGRVHLIERISEPSGGTAFFRYEGVYSHVRCDGTFLNITLI